MLFNHVNEDGRYLTVILSVLVAFFIMMRGNVKIATMRMKKTLKEDWLSVLSFPSRPLCQRTYPPTRAAMASLLHGPLASALAGIVVSSMSVDSRRELCAHIFLNTLMLD